MQSIHHSACKTWHIHLHGKLMTCQGQTRTTEGFWNLVDHYRGSRATTTSSKCPLWPQLRPRFKIIIPLQLLACPAQVADGPEPHRRLGRSVTPWTHCDKSLFEPLVKKKIMPQWSWHAMAEPFFGGCFARNKSTKQSSRVFDKLPGLISDEQLFLTWESMIPLNFQVNGSPITFRWLLGQWVSDSHHWVWMKALLGGLLGTEQNIALYYLPCIWTSAGSAQHSVSGQGNVGFILLWMADEAMWT